MKCGLASLRWNYFLAAYVAVVALMLFAVPAHSAVAPTISIPSVTAMENAPSAQVLIYKTKATSYSKISVQTVDGTAKAGVDYVAVNQTMTLANTVTKFVLYVPLVDNKTYQGPRSFQLKLTCVRFATCPAAPITVTITDDEQPPAPPSWVSAPITDGGYVRCKRAGGCLSVDAYCPQGLNPPAVCTYPDVFAHQGDVMVYRWNGYTSGPTGAFWPIDKVGVPYAGFEGLITTTDWEGVAPATATAARFTTAATRSKAGAPEVGIAHCKDINVPPGGESYSTVEAGERYRAVPVRSRPGIVTAIPVDHPALGATMVVEHDCLKAL